MRQRLAGKQIASLGVAMLLARQFDAVTTDRELLPLYVRGVLSTSRSDPLSVAIVVNGIVAAITHSYRDRDGHMFGTLIPETALRDGNNTVAAFVVDGLPARP